MENYEKNGSEIINKIAQQIVNDVNSALESNNKVLNHLKEGEEYITEELDDLKNLETKYFDYDEKNFDKEKSFKKLKTEFFRQEIHIEDTFEIKNNLKNFYKFSFNADDQKLKEFVVKLEVYEKLYEKEKLDPIDDEQRIIIIKNLKNLKKTKQTEICSGYFNDSNIFLNNIKQLNNKHEQIENLIKEFENFKPKIELLLDNTINDKNYFENYIKNLGNITGFNFKLIENQYPVPDKLNYKYRDEERQCIETYLDYVNNLITKLKSKTKRREEYMVNIYEINFLILQKLKENNNNLTANIKFDDFKEEIMKIEFELDYLCEQSAEVPIIIEGLRKEIKLLSNCPGNFTTSGSDEFDKFVYYQNTKIELDLLKVERMNLEYLLQKKTHFEKLLDFIIFEKEDVEIKLCEIITEIEEEFKEYFDKLQVRFKNNQFYLEKNIV